MNAFDRLADRLPSATAVSLDTAARQITATSTPAVVVEITLGPPGAGHLTVKVDFGDGQPVALPYQDGYEPRVGDVVTVRNTGGQAIVHPPVRGQGGARGMNWPIGLIGLCGMAAGLPEGFVLCRGQSTSTPGYDPIVATMWGSNVPDLRDCFVIGAGSTFTLGSSGDPNRVTLVGDGSGQRFMAIDYAMRVT